MKISKEVKPQTGQIAIIKEMTEMTPTIAPTGINRGLYSQSDSTPQKMGKINAE